MGKTIRREPPGPWYPMVKRPGKDAPPGYRHAPPWYRRVRNRRYRRRANRAAKEGEEVPVWKRDVDWEWF